MKGLLAILFFALAGFTASAQNVNPETEEVKKVIIQLFDGMRKGDIF